MSASNPATSASSGQQVVNGSRQADCLAGQFEPLQVRAGAAGVAFVEDQVEHVQHGAEPLGALLARSASGTARRKP